MIEAAAKFAPRSRSRSLATRNVPLIAGPGHSACASRSESGSALLIVLAFIVILAVVLTAFLSNSKRALQQSEASAALLKTQLLGQVATAAIVEDLNDEMKAGADSVPADGAMMKVSQPWAMLPGRVLKLSTMLTDANNSNLVKQSVSGSTFYPGDSTAIYSSTGKARASNVNTLTPSRNQRFISAERWDKPKLLGGSAGLAKFTSAQLPDWILITRAGAVENGAITGNSANKAPTNSEYVLGRFAYNIYRVDGLLDINAAGFDTMDAGLVTRAASKGSLAWADLRAIPGLTSDTQVQALVDWRNKESDLNYTIMLNGLTPASLPEADSKYWGEAGGFVEPYTFNNKTDNRFYSRQDLLNYFTHQFGTASDQALPFLTTFSADLDQPSFSPDPNRPRVARSATSGGNDAYGDELLVPERTRINPPLLSVLDSDDKPLVKRRFPLDRLKYAYAGGDAGKISEYFGLAWNVAEQAWDYTAADPSDGSIMRLNEITGRKPNMIELLKAAISTGSLGGQLVGVELAGSPRQMGLRDASVDYQILRIAASIIDQYDADSYPTRIRYAGYMACGDEDLPYLYGMRIGSYRLHIVPTSAMDPAKLPPPAPLSAVYRSAIMIQPVLWNPHAPSPTTVTERPAQFRITAKSGNDIRPQARLDWWITPVTTSAYRNAWPLHPTNMADSRDLNLPVGFSPGSDFMTFLVSPDDSKMASFREPYTLKSPDYPPGSLSASYLAAAPFIEAAKDANEQNDIAPLRTDEGLELDNRVIGFRAGWSWSGPWVSTGTATYLQEGRIEGGGIDFELQYLSPTGLWLTYDSYEKFNAPDPYRMDRYATGSENPRHFRYYLRADPRVDRYGAKGSLQLPSGAGMKQGLSMRPGSVVGLPGQTNWPDPAVASGSFNFTIPTATADRYIGLLSENKATGVVNYGDPDGVKRLAMGGYASGTSGLPMVPGNYTCRPVVLNRPFRSVAELGYVLRDQPWKQLDFFTPLSGDAALLDVFCLYEPPPDEDADPVVSGRVNLNTRRPEVIEALLRGVTMQEGGTALTDAQAKTLAQALVNWTSSTDPTKGPLRNRSELVGKLISGTTYSGFSSALDAVLSLGDSTVSIKRQNVMRALADPGTTRSWTFLIDLIVQDGQFIKAGGAANDFIVRGEKRYWVHIGMDRFTGKVISERVEEVYE